MYVETFGVALVTFEGITEGMALDIEGCFHAAGVAAWWHWAGTIAAAVHSCHSRARLLTCYATFDVLLDC